MTVRAVKRSVARTLRPLFASVDEFTLRRLDRIDERLVRAIRNRRHLVGPNCAEKIEAFRETLMADLSLLDEENPDRGTVRDAAAASKPATRARFLHNLAWEYQPKTVIELGTNVGVSSAYIASALKDGKVTTLEGSPFRLAFAKKLHIDLGLTNIDYREGIFVDTLGPTLEAMPPIEMAFIDGHHQYQPTLDYFDLIWRFAAEGCIFIFDDIRWSRGMTRAWHRLRLDRRMLMAVDLAWVGVCMTTKVSAAKPCRTWPMVSMIR